MSSVSRNTRSTCNNVTSDTSNDNGDYRWVECTSVSIQTDQFIPYLGNNGLANFSNFDENSLNEDNCRVTGKFSSDNDTSCSRNYDVIVDNQLNYELENNREYPLIDMQFPNTFNLISNGSNSIDERTGVNRQDYKKAIAEKPLRESCKNFNTTMFEFKVTNVRDKSNDSSISESQDKKELITDKATEEKLSPQVSCDPNITDIGDIDNMEHNFSYHTPEFKELPEMSKRIPLRENLLQTMTESRRSIISVTDSPSSIDRPGELPPTQKSTLKSSDSVTDTVKTDKIASDTSCDHAIAVDAKYFFY